MREGYLLQGNYTHGECVLGEVVGGDYTAGGYFYRPGGVVNGGPLSGASDGDGLVAARNCGRQHGTPRRLPRPVITAFSR